MIDNKKYKVGIYIFIEKINMFFSKCKILFIALLFILLSICIIKNRELVNNIFENDTLVGVGGTLLGAIIGGFLSIIGSVSVSKHQIKAQAQIKRKNEIYKPLYDELSKNHNHILKENPYPAYIKLTRRSQEIKRVPEFMIWEQIKVDSRYLETPKNLMKLMNKLESDIKAYNEIRNKSNEIIIKILNSVLQSELGIAYTISTIDDNFITCILLNENCILLDENIDLFEQHLDLCRPIIEIDEQNKRRVQDIFVTECKSNENIIEIKEKYKIWLQSEKDAILLLEAMIKRINATYER